MDYSTKISERMWNQLDKGKLEAERENTFIDDIVQESNFLSSVTCMTAILMFAEWVRTIFLPKGKSDMTVEILGANRHETYTKTREGCRAVIMRDGKILLTHELNSGWWLLPGGGLGAGAARAQCLYISKHGKKEFLKVQTGMHEKHDFQKVQEILGQDYKEALNILEEKEI